MPINNHLQSFLIIIIQSANFDSANATRTPVRINTRFTLWLPNPRAFIHMHKTKGMFSKLDLLFPAVVRTQLMHAARLKKSREIPPINRDVIKEIRTWETIQVRGASQLKRDCVSPGLNIQLVASPSTKYESSDKYLSHETRKGQIRPLLRPAAKFEIAPLWKPLQDLVIQS